MDDVPKRLYARLIDQDEHDGHELPDEVVDEVPGNATKQVAALTLQNVGDVVVDPKTVLAWLLAGVGAPAALAGLLVPIREAGSLLPQAQLVPLLRRYAVRRWVWVAGAVGQAAAVVLMAAVAATASGRVAGWGILAALALFAVARSLSSLTSKDVLGRTIPKGQRGQVTGFATLTAGGVAVTLGLVLRVAGGPDTPPATFAFLLLAAAAAWVAAAAVYARVVEMPRPPDIEHRSRDGALALLRHDAPFRRFVVARTLLLVSALSPPFVVVLATEVGGVGLAGLGPFVIGSGIAALVGGRLWGRLADRSSRLVMVVSAGSASAVVLGLLLLLRGDAIRELALVYPAAYLLLALCHTGARIGRKTYVVDLAEDDRRTAYVAVSNAAMGVLLLVTGAVSSMLALLGAEVALVFLAVLGAAGVPVGLRLPEVTSR